jgi:hypothetical protein
MVPSISISTHKISQYHNSQKKALKEKIKRKCLSYVDNSTALRIERKAESLKPWATFDDSAIEIIDDKLSRLKKKTALQLSCWIAELLTLAEIPSVLLREGYIHIKRILPKDFVKEFFHEEALTCLQGSI